MTRVLWAGPDPPEAPSSAGIELVHESEFETATQRVADEEFDVVIVDSQQPDEVAEVLSIAVANPHVERRMVVSTYDGMPELVRCVEPGLIQRVLAKPVSGAQLVHAVAGADPSESVIYRQALNDPAELSDREVDRRLQDLVDELVDLPTTVIRPLLAKDPIPRLQLVVPITDPFQTLRRDLPRVLGWPLKASGSGMGKDYRNHPLRKILGTLSDAQEVYALGRENVAYVALFPWSDDLKVTVVVGYHETERGRVATLHAHAVARAREFPLPSRHRHSPQMFYDPDYDWVITGGYVGPDRRRKSTAFLSRYTFRGRRKVLMPNEFTSVGTFVDIAPKWTWAAAVAFGVLFLFDTAMTAYFVGSGHVGELNPVMRWALDRSPWLFWAAKTAIVLLAGFIVMRWHLWRPGRWIFASAIAIYAALDLYWIVLWFSDAL